MATKKITKNHVYRVEVSWFKRFNLYGPPYSPRTSKKEGRICSTHFTVLATDVKDAMEQVKKIKIIEYTYKPYPPTDVEISNKELIFDEVKYICELKHPTKYHYEEHHRSEFD